MKKHSRRKFVVLMLSFCVFLGVPFNVYAATNENSKDKKVINNPVVSNNYPIIMVHGLLGWGNDELFGLNYWGGFESLREILDNEGYEVYTPTVGSLSSNWDRACELYAYIKGGIVDYGEAHSRKYGHERYGRTYPGVYPQMGMLSKTGEIAKVHLLGHSMGGQTIRTMTQLLKTGSLEEIAVTPKDRISPLFTGGKSWVSSITTLATPHDGSPIANDRFNNESCLQQLIGALAAQGGIIDSNNPCFDFRLDQWGLRKRPCESFDSYLHRVADSNIWKTTKDTSMWDLSPEGARELNTWVKAQDDIYYFSLACVATHENILTKHQVPDITMNSILKPYSYFIGSYTNNKPGEVTVDKTWWRNDGLVSVVSAKCPTVGSTDKMINYNGIPQKGVWNYLGEKNFTDHLDIVGLYECDYALIQEYFDMAEMLRKLPR